MSMVEKETEVCNKPKNYHENEVLEIKFTNFPKMIIQAEIESIMNSVWTTSTFFLSYSCTFSQLTSLIEEFAWIEYKNI